MKAVIQRSAARVFDCLLATGETIQAKALGNLLKDDGLVVGDEVGLLPEGNEFVISSIEPRRSEIFRHLAREKRKKIIAANCDVLVLVAPVSRPGFKRGLLDRYLVRARQWGLPSVVVFHKMDEFKPKKLDLNFEKARLGPVVSAFYETSCVDPNFLPLTDSGALKDLRLVLKGKTAIFLGQSGVGKSSLITSLAEGQVELLQGELGKVGKGKHTTTWCELIQAGGFRLIDSPGIRSYGLDDLELEDLNYAFPEIAELACQCQFRDCSHESSVKGCAFYPLTNLPLASRLESYQRLKEEVEKTPTWEKN